MSKEYGIDEAMVQIQKADGSTLGIFDVSPTIECRWIAISSQAWSLLTVFGDTREMLKFVAREQIAGATVPNTDGWLDEQAGMDGFDTWAQYVLSEGGKCEHLHVTVHWRKYAAASLYEPAEHVGRAECQDCGEWMEPEDVPAEAERNDVNE